MNSTRSITLETEPPPREATSSERLFDDHFDAVFRYLSRRLGSVEEAQDVAAETFAAAMTARRPHRVDVRCWLYGIARRKLADAYRKRRPTVRLDETLADPANMATVLEVRQWVDALPGDQREALLLQALEDLSVEEIAQVMHRSRASVKALLQRAKERLRRDHALEFIPEVKQ